MTQVMCCAHGEEILKSVRTWKIFPPPFEKAPAANKTTLNSWVCCWVDPALLVQGCYKLALLKNESIKHSANYMRTLAGNNISVKVWTEPIRRTQQWAEAKLKARGLNVVCRVTETDHHRNSFIYYNIKDRHVGFLCIVRFLFCLNHRLSVCPGTADVN